VTPIRLVTTIWIVCCAFPAFAQQRGQVVPKTSPPATATKAAAPTFTCPDPLAAKACASYLELVTAGDDGVKTSAMREGIAYVCFRQPVDAFFVLNVDAPMFDNTHYNAVLKKMVPDVGAESGAYGWMHAYANGVGDDAAAPLHWFRGLWTPILGGAGFKADLSNGRTGDENESALYIDSSQIDASVRFKNRFEKDIDYRLVIQRSTGRFVERYLETPSKVPFSEVTGRCSSIPGMR
jgi:hypothetical protein